MLDPPHGSPNDVVKNTPNKAEKTNPAAKQGHVLQAARMTATATKPLFSIKTKTRETYYREATTAPL